MNPNPQPARERFLSLFRESVSSGSFIKLTLSRPMAKDSATKNVFVRPVQLKAGPHLSLLHREERRDTTKNLPVDEGVVVVAAMIGAEFGDAHLFTTQDSAELRCRAEGPDTLRVRQASADAPQRSDVHNRAKAYPVPADSPWLRSLGVTNERGEPRSEMSAKFRQIQKYAEILRHLLEEAGLGGRPARIVDMGCGKGYLTFAVASQASAGARVVGVELRPDLVEKSNAVAREHGMEGLVFVAGAIADAPLDKPDVVIALHACDTATDDALARGIESGASLLVAAPCCQKELRPQLRPSPVMEDALRHGIFAERQAEFATDAMRAMLLEWAGYRTRVMEFVSTEHTAKNLMIAAIKDSPAGDASKAERIRAFARFYGIRSQALARHLGFDLTQP